MEYQGTLNLRFVSRQRQLLHEIGRLLEATYFGVDVNLQSRPMGVIHQEQAGLVLRGKVTEADVLTVAPEVGACQRTVIKDLQKSCRSPAMLHVRPAGFRDRGQVEAVTSGNELLVRRGEP